MVAEHVEGSIRALTQQWLNLRSDHRQNYPSSHVVGQSAVAFQNTNTAPSPSQLRAACTIDCVYIWELEFVFAGPCSALVESFKYWTLIVVKFGYKPKFPRQQLPAKFKDVLYPQHQARQNDLFTRFARRRPLDQWSPCVMYYHVTSLFPRYWSSKTFQLWTGYKTG